MNVEGFLFFCKKFLRIFENLNMAVSYKGFLYIKKTSVCVPMQILQSVNHKLQYDADFANG